jgi:hypothetical protein
MRHMIPSERSCLRADTIELAFAIVTFEAPEGPAADPSIQNDTGWTLSLPTRSAHGSGTSGRTPYSGGSPSKANRQGLAARQLPLGLQPHPPHRRRVAVWRMWRLVVRGRAAEASAKNFSVAISSAATPARSIFSITPLALLAVDPQFAGPDIVPNDNSVTRQGPFPVIGEANTEIKRNVFGSPFPREMAAEVILRKLVTVEVALSSVRCPCCQEQRRNTSQQQFFHG